MDYRVLFYYKYVIIDDFEIFVVEYLKFCKEYYLKGRILVLMEGINGILFGIKEDIDKYIEYMYVDNCFVDLIFKIDEVESYVFKKMYVCLRCEIVVFDLEEDINLCEIIGKYYFFKEFKVVLEDENIVILDVWNDYEYDLGYFCGVICFDIIWFCDLFEWVCNNKE